MFHVGLCNLDFFLFFITLCVCGGGHALLCQCLCLKMCMHMSIHVCKSDHVLNL